MAKKKHVYHMSASKRREAKRRAFYEAHKKPIITACIAAAAALVLLIIAFDFFYTPGGSMRVFFGKLLGAEENAIIREVKDGRFYTLANMDVPEGYQPEDYGLVGSMEDQAQYRYLVDTTGEKAIASVYVSGVKNQTGEGMIATLSSTGYYANQGEATQAEIAGHTVNYLYTQNNSNMATSEEEELPDEHFASLIMYVDSIQGSCVLLSCNSQENLPLAELPTEEAMLAEAEAILSCLSIPQE